MGLIFTEEQELERFYTSLGMRKFAGDFFKCIGEALGHTDPTNYQIIKEVWKEECERFYKRGKEHWEKTNKK